MTATDTQASFWVGVAVREPHECWLWQRGRKNGFGRLQHEGVETYAHRLAYVVSRGRIPPDLHVMHVCREKLCCNPGHLELGAPGHTRR
jgi:hypothetical protein